MDQLKQRIKAVDSTLLSLEQVYTILSHVSSICPPHFPMVLVLDRTSIFRYIIETLEPRKKEKCTLIQKDSELTVFENYRKSLIRHCERSELRLHLEWTKVN